MSPRTSLACHLAAGFDLVVPIDPDAYTITEDAAGRAYALDFAEAREDIADAVGVALQDVREVADCTIAPGYVRARVDPVDEDHADPKRALEALRSAPGIYNDRHTTDADLDGLAFEYDYYLGSYRPEDAPSREDALGNALDIEAAPDLDGPVFERVRDDAPTDDVLREDRRFAYRFTLPFAPDIFEQEDFLFGQDKPPVVWDREEVRDALRIAVDDLPMWPGRSGNLPRVTVNPTHVVVEHYSAGLGNPHGIAAKIHDALLRYNRYRSVDEERSNRPSEVIHHPKIAFDGQVYVEALPHDRGAEAWINDHDLNAVDGEPTHPEPDTPDAEDDEPESRMDALNPFGD